jgi:hypothetical protein
MPKFEILGLPPEKMKIPRAHKQLADNFALAELDEPCVRRYKLSKSAQQTLRKSIRDAYLEGWVRANVERDEATPGARTP